MAPSAASSLAETHSPIASAFLSEFEALPRHRQQAAAGDGLTETGVLAHRQNVCAERMAGVHQFTQTPGTKLRLQLVQAPEEDRWPCLP